jgi:hypothetical protein
METDKDTDKDTVKKLYKNKNINHQMMILLFDVLHTSIF